MADKLNIACEQMVSFPVGNGVYQNILFKATQATKTAILNARSIGRHFDVTVQDNGGGHVTTRPHRVLSTKSERLVFTYTSQEM